MLRLLSTLSTLLIALVLFASCQRQQAFYQRSATTQYAQQTTQAPVATLVGTSDAVVISAESVPESAPALEAIRQVRQQLGDAVASNRAGLVDNKVLAKRMVRAEKLLAAAEQNMATGQVAAKKLTLVQRVMLKKLDTKIRKQLAPEEAQVMNRSTKTGLILIVAGLLAQFIPVVNILGIIAILAGLVFLLIGITKS